jgi:hypothetical protein
MALSVDRNQLRDRDPSFKPVDIAAIRAIAQAAVDVELFTIPLYMTSLYSIQGMHQITSQGNDFYKGRLWPGPAPSANPQTANEKAFNIIFSVFIQEMLHLQLASNIATAIGVTPTYTGPALQNADHGWICYGPTLTVIPYIIDLKDTKEHKDVVVNLGPVSVDQLKLFLAIEEPEKVAKDYIDPDKIGKYFPTVPFANWAPHQPLPMFGTIGWMYQCYKDYLDIEYSDGSTLWEAAFNPGAQQNDMFNNFVAGGHPMREFMGFESTVALTYPDIAKLQIVQMMDAITDQGEGATLKFRLVQARALNLLSAVAPSYQSSQPALESDYPNFSDVGKLEPSADAEARYENDKIDHYERFQIVYSMLSDIVSWPQWLASHGPWKTEDLQTPDYPGPDPYHLPTTQQTADALNTLAGTSANYTLLTQAAIGAIAGVTTVLDDYWNAQKQAQKTVLFPMPSMGGSGDRMAICWAVFGKAPDLSIGLAPPAKNTLFHACQSLDFNGQGTNDCANVAIFHTCKGSNNCRAQGGCGFVQMFNTGTAPSNCSSKLKAETMLEVRTFGGCNPFANGPYSAPSDNKCGSFGGCAVPISAYQLFPKSGNMQLFDFVQESDGSWKPEEIPGATIDFGKGMAVHAIAYKAYQKVMEHRGKTVPDNPAPPNTLRLAFPPST